MAQDLDSLGEDLAGLLEVMVATFVGVAQAEGLSALDRVGVARAAVSLPSDAITPSVANMPSVAIMPISVSQHLKRRPSLAPRDVEPLYAAAAVARG